MTNTRLPRRIGALTAVAVVIGIGGSAAAVAGIPTDPVSPAIVEESADQSPDDQDGDTTPVPGSPATATDADPDVRSASNQPDPPQAEPADSATDALEAPAIAAAGLSESSAPHGMTAVAASDDDLRQGRTDEEIFPDAVLRQCVRTWLETYGRIDLADDQLIPLDTVAALNAAFSCYAPVTDLTGVQMLRAAPSIAIESAALTDISPIADMPSVTNVTLLGTAVTDVRPLSGMSLTKMSLYNSAQFTDLSPLAELPLTSLIISGTAVSDLSPLSGMESLGALLLANTPVTDLSPLAGLSLTQVIISNTSISDISALSGMSTLRTLTARSAELSDISALSGLALSMADLSDNHIVDLTPLADSGDIFVTAGNQTVTLPDVEVGTSVDPTTARGLNPITVTRLSGPTATLLADGLWSFDDVGTAKVHWSNSDLSFSGVATRQVIQVTPVEPVVPDPDPEQPVEPVVPGEPTLPVDPTLPDDGPKGEVTPAEDPALPTDPGTTPQAAGVATATGASDQRVGTSNDSPTIIAAQPVANDRLAITGVHSLTVIILAAAMVAIGILMRMSRRRRS